MKKLLVFIFFSIGIIQVFAQQTDSTSINVSKISNRLGFTESSRTVYRGAFNVEVDYAYTKIRSVNYPSIINIGDNREVTYERLPGIKVGFGATRNLAFYAGFGFNQVKLVGLDYLGGQMKDFPQVTSKFKSYYVGLKVNVFKQKRLLPEIALNFSVGGNNEPEFVYAEGDSGGKIGLAWSYQLGQNWRISGDMHLGNIEHKSVMGEMLPITLKANYELHETLGVFSGIGYNLYEGKYFPVAAGLYYLFTPNMMLDVSVYYVSDIGVHNQYESWMVSAGFSWLIL